MPVLSIYGAKYAFDKLKNKRDEQKFIKFNTSLKEKRINSLKDIFNKIKERAFNNKLLNAVNIQNNLKERILKKAITKHLNSHRNNKIWKMLKRLEDVRLMLA